MKRIVISTLLLLLGSISGGVAQNRYDAILNEIESNSTTLSLIREQIAAQKLGNRSGISLSNPSVEFGYLWIDPSSMGTRTNISVKQEFDFPTLYRHRNTLAKSANANLDLNYKAERINLLLGAKLILVDLVYYNALEAEYAVRLHNAERIAAGYQKRLVQGDANLIESNKAALNLTVVQNKMAGIKAEQASLLAELRRLNGAKPIEFAEQTYPAEALPSDFEIWFAQAESVSPTLQYLASQIGLSREQVKVNRAMGLPSFSVGYMNEKVVDQRSQGFSIGMSIPLWENNNRVKQAKAEVKASQSALDDGKMQFYARLQNLYQRALSLQLVAENSRAALTSYSNNELLGKALDSGEISLLSYLLEMDYYYDALNSVLEAQRTLEQAKAELSAVEL